ncbi:hypothetical protein [Pseudovibrio sp. Alg231-02]|uniref:hypothetical protein n=1 Tax=Pseudovibrio sp. Alg231-02 TaxID=1922223 RepID=UPI001AD8BE95|nr:hypothetical protein [Pseudovibrio sp. Alg231-02]
MRPAIMSKAAWQLEAAENNADLYQLMFEAHGIPYERSKELFHTIVLPLPFYSSIVTCLPATKPELVNDFTRTATVDVYVKDSFADLPLEQFGFKKLFDASWFYLTEIVKADTVGWEQIKTARQLEHWEAAWKTSGNQTDCSMFPPALLTNPNITFWGYAEAGKYTKGFIGNWSGSSIGLSNIFAGTLSPKDLQQMACLLQAWQPSAPIVGYARGETLHSAKQTGFETSGNLTVWVKQFSPS